MIDKGNCSKIKCMIYRTFDSITDAFQTLLKQFDDLSEETFDNIMKMSTKLTNPMDHTSGSV